MNNFAVPRLGSRGEDVKVNGTGERSEETGVVWFLDAEWDQV